MQQRCLSVWQPEVLVKKKVLGRQVAQIRANYRIYRQLAKSGNGQRSLFEAWFLTVSLGFVEIYR